MRDSYSSRVLVRCLHIALMSLCLSLIVGCNNHRKQDKNEDKWIKALENVCHGWGVPWDPTRANAAWIFESSQVLYHKSLSIPDAYQANGKPKSVRFVIYLEISENKIPYTPSDKPLSKIVILTQRIWNLRLYDLVGHLGGPFMK